MKIFLSVLLLLSSFAAVAAPRPLNLAEALALAEKQNGEIRAQAFQEKQSEQDIARVKGEFGPKLEGIIGIGPITKAEGSATYAVEDKGYFGRIVIGKITLTQPLYAWGRSDNYKNAARAGVKVKQAETDLKISEVRHQVKEAYYGYQLANSLMDFIVSGKADLEKARSDRGKKRSGAKEDYKMEIFLQEVNSREAEVKKYLELAKEGFALRVGSARTTVIPKEEWLLPKTRAKKDVDFYIRTAREMRPEFRQLGEGIFAKRSLGHAEKKGDYPVFALLAGYELADTDVRTPQPGVFAYDPYNREVWTLGVGFKWDFQWGLQAAKSAKHFAEAQELEAKESFAKQGIETEVRKAFLELEEAETRLTAATEAYKLGKKWLTGQLIAYGSGLGSEAGIVEAYGARAETAKNYFEAVFRHHMAWANLSKIVGDEVDPILLAAE